MIWTQLVQYKKYDFNRVNKVPQPSHFLKSNFEIFLERDNFCIKYKQYNYLHAVMIINLNLLIYILYKNTKIRKKY